MTFGDIEPGDVVFERNAFAERPRVFLVTSKGDDPGGEAVLLGLFELQHGYETQSARRKGDVVGPGFDVVRAGEGK